jgi:hypothetical protein
MLSCRAVGNPAREAYALMQLEVPMISLHEGQCGLCTHFGETHKPMSEKLIQIHASKRAPEDFLDDCGHPKHASLHLKVTPMSGCDGFVPAAQA